MVLIDTHAHVYLPTFDGDRAEMIARARAAGVEAVVLPAIDVASVERAIALAEAEPGFFYAMAALHPSETKDATEADVARITDLCDHPAVVAVGESGLDYYWDRGFDQKQQAIFRQHIRLAMEKDLPLILHLRDKQGRDACHRDVVRLLREERAATDQPDRLRGIFHCFGGPAWMLDAADELNFLLGLGGTLTFKNSGVADLVRDVPLEKIVLETDAPYLAPVPHRGKRNEPAYVRLVAEKLAEVKGLTVEDIAAQTTANARALFGL